ncbi:cytochrome P450 [Brevibacillus agri]|uniref:Cytochrome P450 n=1 Tax=Brevibacillus agri TaxID=51101 RepID=A0A3M8AJM3_9BACL|nr:MULTISPECIES: cytochrome P450 [Brevibacillus]ELK43469.1 cytochrome P450 [Brevibacillus agri BAB-2500]EJL47363.1 cytochrome P450 [Brevibacillus sp. CF112]MBG9567007.1 cytochrome P450 [Brevibacillus agri]MCG5253011.1 cytochrome P450 [Brevibacillus agri]MDN4094203.1 cytochrome P450 [Brevibacillus agri]
MGVTISGPRGLPISGNLLAFRKDPLQFIRDAVAEHGDVVHFRFGPKRHVYLLTNPDQIKEVLVTKQDHFKKGKGLQVARAVVGDGILTSEGKKHMRQRRLMQPAFHRERIAGYGQAMVRQAVELLEDWKAGEVRDIHDDMMRVTLAIITETMFGKSIKEGADKIGHAIDVGLKYVANKASSFIDIPLSVPTKSNRQFLESNETLDQTIYSLIEERRNSQDDRQDDLLGMLLAARDEDDGQGMTDEQVRDEVMTIFVAGHETTANTMSWIFYLLATHPHVEAKLHEELATVLDGRLPTVDDLPKLTYTSLIVSETLRLYPAAWTINREVVEEVQIGDHTYQPGDTLMMSQFVMHRLERYYEKPDEFIPERFAGDLLKRNPTYAYFPFGGGPRVCIGNNFALMEAALLLATIAQRYRLRLAEPGQVVEPEPLVTLRPKNGLPMRLEKRE